MRRRDVLAGAGSALAGVASASFPAPAIAQGVRQLTMVTDWTETMPGLLPSARRLARTITTAPPAPGFGGPGHEAVFVVDAADYVNQDPFILLADDRLDLPAGKALGGEHPHAGFEIATFVVAGGLDEGDEGALREGDVLKLPTSS